MWTLLKSRDTTPLKAGAIIRTRSGSSIGNQYEIHEGQLYWKVVDANNCVVGTSTRPITRETLSQFNEFYGRTIDLKTGDQKVALLPPGKYTAKLISKEMCRLTHGLRLRLVPHDSNRNDRHEYGIVISVHGNIVQAHISRDNMSYRTQTWSYDSKYPRSFTEINVVNLDKHFCYLLEEGQKLCPNGAKAIPEVDEDAGQFIIWAPSADVPPKKILTSAKQAKAVAATMSERYGKTFYWCKLMGKVEQEVKIVKTTNTKITEL